jgi:hypothetical protein
MEIKIGNERKQRTPTLKIPQIPTHTRHNRLLHLPHRNQDHPNLLPQLPQFLLRLEPPYSSAAMPLHMILHQLQHVADLAERLEGFFAETAAVSVDFEAELEG